MKNTVKPEKDIGKGINNAFCDEIKEQIAKRKVVGCRLTESEHELYLIARGERTDSAYIRWLIKNDAK